MGKISVLMPIYKTNEKYLRSAIESILSQTFTDFEFLILDDCPEDDREKIAKSYSDKRIRYMKNDKNLGISASRNKLIDMAKGKYLAVMDHDDVSMPERFNKQVEFLDANSDYGVVGCKSQKMSTDKQLKNPTNDHDIKLALIRSCAITHPASMIRKSVLIDNKIRYEKAFSPAEDYALWCRLIPFTKFHNLNNEVLFKYNDHKENTSHKQKVKMTMATYRVWSFMKTKHPELYEEFLLKSKKTKKIYLFGFIPFITTITQANRTKIYLLKKIPLFTSKTVIKLQEIG